MDKRTCDNCAYLFKAYLEGYLCPSLDEFVEEKPTVVCDIHNYSCMNNSCVNEASYEYEGKAYCFDCLMDKFNVEEHVTTVYYDKDGEHLGTSEDCYEVIQNLSKDIKIL